MAKKQQYIFKKKYAKELQNGIDIKNYSADEFAYDKTQTKVLSNIYCVNENLEADLIKNVGNDFEAARILYEAYPDLNPLVAAMPEFWIYLTHVDLFRYVKKRWPLDDESVKKALEEGDGDVEEMSDTEVDEQDTTTADDSQRTSEQKLIDYIKNHWFKTKHIMRTTLMNLWWSVYTTIDDTPNCADPYRLTRYFFSRQDLRTRRLGTATFFRHREAAIGILEFMIENDNGPQSLMQDYFEGKMIYIAKYFNMQGGIKQLVYMDRDYFKNELKQKISVMRTIKKREDILKNFAILRV